VERRDKPGYLSLSLPWGGISQLHESSPHQVRDLLGVAPSCPALGEVGGGLPDTVHLYGLSALHH
jgi:hypothetical protein